MDKPRKYFTLPSILLIVSLLFVVITLVAPQGVLNNVQDANAQLDADAVCTQQYGQRCATVYVSTCRVLTCRQGIPPEDQPNCDKPTCSPSTRTTKCGDCLYEQSTGEGSPPGTPTPQCVASWNWAQCQANSGGLCTLNSSANYQSAEVVCGDYCTTGSWTNQTCGGGSCSPTEMYQTRSTNPSGCAYSTRCVADATCGGGETPYCGDGSVNQSSEQCDLGSGNGPFPATCSATCRINPPPSGGSYCGDGILDSSYTMNRAISTGNDDGYSSNSSVFDRTKNYGLAGEDNNTSYTYNSWFRFANIFIPKGSTVTNAKLNVRSSTETFGSGAINTLVRGVAEDNHVAPASAGDWVTDEGKHTSNSVSWGFTMQDSYGTLLTSPNFSSIIQEIINRSGWSSGNAIGIHWDENMGNVDVSQGWATYESSYAEPQLSITYVRPEGAEECDDGNNVNGDGCSAACQIERTPICPNGIVESPETCDDGNTTNGDGCSSTCQTESSPPICGDGEVNQPSEDCDGTTNCQEDCTIAECVDGSDNDGDLATDGSDLQCDEDCALTDTCGGGNGGCTGDGCGPCVGLGCDDSEDEETPVVWITATPKVVARGGTTLLDWGTDSTGAVTCTSNSDPDDTEWADDAIITQEGPGEGINITLDITGITTFSITCINSELEPGSASVDVVVLTIKEVRP